MESMYFDQYEYVTLILPGAVALAWVAVMFGKATAFGQLKDTSLGGFGLLVVSAYVAGHLVAVLGMGMECAWRLKIHGFPTDRIIREKTSLFTPEEMNSINGNIKKVLKRSDVLPNPNMSDEQSGVLRRRIYDAVAAAGGSKHVDIFNRHYGFLRNLTGAFLFCAVFTFFRVGSRDVFHRKWMREGIALGFLLAAAGTFYRMTGFGWDYARELFIQFLHLSP